MKVKKIICFLLLPLFIGSLAFSQSLAELAKKEKERRENLKKRGVVVTNAELAALKKKPALETPVTETAALPESLLEGEEEETVPPTEQVRTPSAPPLEKPTELQLLERQKLQERRAEVEQKLNQTTELIELLELKMNALWQKFYNMDGMTTRDTVEMEISETSLKLEQAKEEENKLREELEKILAAARREGMPSIWIR